jgi:uncharacterized protein (DUF2147 family)
MIRFFWIGLVLLFVTEVNAQIEGLWYNVDDEDGKPKSQISIYESNGKLEAKVVKLLPAATLTHCKECEGANKNQPIEGMKILWGLDKVNPREYEEGEILNPKNGKVYDCFITLEEEDKLKVRGYLGISMFGKTQYWYRVKS